MATNATQGRFKLGADITFPAIIFPLPDEHQDTLKKLAHFASLARVDGRVELHRAAVAELDGFVETLRSAIGVPISRPEFLAAASAKSAPLVGRGA